MTTSQNGWPASSDPHALGVVSPKVPGTTVDFPQGMRGGDVEVVLMYVAEQFNEHVEKLHDGWCWGYDYKQIEGGSSLSNHASATALDFNAPSHPMGSHGTFSSTEVTAIRKILSFCGGVVRWGGDYSGRKDEMHFEINSTAAAVSRLADKIRALKNPPPATSAILKKGSTGSLVRFLQQFLRDAFPAYRSEVSVQPGQLITVDGDYGDQTVAWVKEFQSRTSLTQDGEVGPLTLAALRRYGYSH